ncbi:MAG: hypothetical protein NC489_45470 [Ruminococcus flavefaciens]|nr:hypothetical protein [Ruminococcus flavefaciens]
MLNISASCVKIKEEFSPMTQAYFTITGIPEQLGPRPDGKRRPLTLGEIETIMWRDRQFVLPVVGDCMERAGIVDGGWVAVDTTRFPAPPRNGSEDACLCYATFPGQYRPMVMVKSYIGLWGPWHTVTTRYRMSEEHPYDIGMMADAIFGVIYASWDADGRILWQRDPSTFPDGLGSTPTIRGINVGEPMQLRREATA